MVIRAAAGQALLEALSGTGVKQLPARQEVLAWAERYYGLRGLANRGDPLAYAWHNVTFAQALQAFQLFMETGGAFQRWPALPGAHA